MTAYLSFEWLKFSRRWMPRIILLLLLGLTVVAFWGQSTRSFDLPNLLLPRGWLAALSFCAFFAPFFWPVLGGSWAGNEYGWGTIRTILTRRPYRIEYVLAALIVLLLGVGIGLLAILAAASLAALVIALVTGNAAFTSSLLTGAFLATMGKGYLTAWFVSSFYLLLAYGAAVVFRSAAVGIGVGIGSTLAQVVLTRILFELGGVWLQIAQHFPFRYTQGMISQVVHSYLVAGTNLGTVDQGTPSATESLLTIGIFSAVILAVTLIAVRVRDVTA